MTRKHYLSEETIRIVLAGLRDFCAGSTRGNCREPVLLLVEGISGGRESKILRDNGSSYVSAETADYLEDKCKDHVRGAPHHPQT